MNTENTSYNTLMSIYVNTSSTLISDCFVKHIGVNLCEDEHHL